MQVVAGKKYDITLDFEYLQSDAQLNFDMGFKRKVDIARSVDAVKEADVVILSVVFLQVWKEKRWALTCLASGKETV